MNFLRVATLFLAFGLATALPLDLFLYEKQECLKGNLNCKWRTTTINISTLKEQKSKEPEVWHNLDEPISEEAFLALMDDYEDNEEAFAKDLKAKTAQYFRERLPEVVGEPKNGGEWNCYTKNREMITYLDDDYKRMKSIEIESQDIAFSVVGTNFVSFAMPKQKLTTFCWN